MDSEEVVVSVICITYNHEKYIRDALEGFVNQKTDFRYEVIVHDDASTDGTTDIIREYEQKYPDVIRPIYQTENQYSKLTPQGISLAKYWLPLIKGRYVATCEGDDYWMDRYKMQKQVDFMEKNPEYVVCVHNTRIEDLINPAKNPCELKVVNGSIKAYDITFSDAVQNGSGAVYQMSSFLCRVQHYRKAYLEPRPYLFSKAIGFGDWVMIIFSVLEGKVRYLPDIMSVYRFGVEGSYTLRMLDISERIKQRKILVEFTKGVNEYTDYQYSDAVYSAQRVYEFQLAYLTGDYNCVRKKENTDLWLGLSRKDKIKFFLRCKLPGLYKCYKKLKG